MNRAASMDDEEEDDAAYEARRLRSRAARELHFALPWGVIHSLCGMFVFVWFVNIAFHFSDWASVTWVHIWIGAHLLLGACSHWFAHLLGRQSAAWFLAGFIFSLPGVIWAATRPALETSDPPPSEMGWRERLRDRVFTRIDLRIYLAVALLLPLFIAWYFPEMERGEVLLLNGVGVLCFLLRALEPPPLASAARSTPSKRRFLSLPSWRELRLQLSGFASVFPFFLFLATAMADPPPTGSAWLVILFCIYSTAERLRFDPKPQA